MLGCGGGSTQNHGSHDTGVPIHQRDVIPTPFKVEKGKIEKRGIYLHVDIHK